MTAYEREKMTACELDQIRIDVGDMLSELERMERDMMFWMKRLKALVERIESDLKKEEQAK